MAKFRMGTLNHTGGGESEKSVERCHRIPTILSFNVFNEIVIPERTVWPGLPSVDGPSFYTDGSKMDKGIGTAYIVFSLE